MKKKARCIMIQGTMSNAGKSLVTAGICRYFANRGLKVAPFKSQNMALNSFVTKEGLEMGRAQVMQAQAAKTEPSVRMNPILLKPTGDTGSQVIVQGRVLDNMEARSYFAYKPKLIPVIMEALESLREEYDLIVIEGAGSPAEINLKENDIVNMGMAAMADAPVLLVGDIDRGGVFAQLYGTVMLLEEEERRRIRGLIINKFRGDPSLLDSGIAQIEELLGIPVCGVLPYANIRLDDEDSLSERLCQQKEGAVDIAVIHLPHISNFTDLSAFDPISRAGVRFVDRAASLGRPDLLILPGSKNTAADLMWLHESGLATGIIDYAKEGRPLFGICGGFQMLGETVVDEVGAEGGNRAPGLGLLPLSTTLEEEKITRQKEGKLGQLTGILSPLSGMEYTGYEIHMGRSFLLEEGGQRPIEEGVLCRGNIYGTYLHGIFDAPGIAEKIVAILAGEKGLSPEEEASLSPEEWRESQYEALAKMMEQHMDMDFVRSLLEE